MFKNSLLVRELHEFRKFLKQARKLWWERRAFLIKDLKWEKALGIDTAGDYYPQEDASQNRDMTCYVPTPFLYLEELRDSLRMTPEDVFVDIGAGKGRVICFMAGLKLKKVVGVELDPVLRDAARKNIERLKVRNSPIELAAVDAADYDVSEGTVFFFFYPFKHTTFNRVLQNIKKSLGTHPRSVRLVYRSCSYRERWILGMQKDWLQKAQEGNFLIYRSIGQKTS
jgi:hypothetical protein